MMDFISPQPSFFSQIRHPIFLTVEVDILGLFSLMPIQLKFLIVGLDNFTK